MTEPLDEKGLPDPNDAARWNAEAEAHALETLRTSQGLAASPSPSMEMEVVASLRKQAAEEVKEWNDNWRLPSVEAPRSAEDSHLWKAADIIVSLSAQVLRLTEENEALRKERTSLIETKREQIERLQLSRGAASKVALDAIARMKALEDLIENHGSAKQIRLAKALKENAL